jgi:hypothetical protein
MPIPTFKLASSILAGTTEIVVMRFFEHAKFLNENSISRQFF